MIALILFWVGLAVTIYTGIKSWYTPGQTKIGAALFPIALLLAAAVAKYLGL